MARHRPGHYTIDRALSVVTCMSQQYDDSLTGTRAALASCLIAPGLDTGVIVDHSSLKVSRIPQKMIAIVTTEG